MSTLVLSSAIVSKLDLDEVLLELHNYAGWFSHNAVKEKVHAKRGTPPPIISQEALDIIRQLNGTAELSAKSLENIISIVAVYRDRAETVTITLAAPANHQIKERLTSWFRTNISPHTLIDFTYNRTLLGGMVVRIGSRIYDWSFRHSLNEQKDRIPELLNNV